MCEPVLVQANEDNVSVWDASASNASILHRVVIGRVSGVWGMIEYGTLHVRRMISAVCW